MKALRRWQAARLMAKLDACAMTILQDMHNDPENLRVVQREALWIRHSELASQLEALR